jgi:hypothetical protein
MANHYLDTRMLAFYDELDREMERASDRGAAIIAASGLELLLDRLLEASLVSGTFPSKELSTFSAKVWLCHALGLLSEDEARDLDLIRKIRNSFAHDIDASLDTGPSSSRCRELKLGERLYAPPNIPFLRDEDNVPYMVMSYPENLAPPELEVTMPDPTDTRQRLVVTTRVLMRVLQARSGGTPDPRPTTPAEYEVDEPARLFVERIERLLGDDDEAGRRTERRKMLERLEAIREQMMALPEGHERRLEFEQLEKDIRPGVDLDAFIVTAARLARYSYETVRENRRRQGAAE